MTNIPHTNSKINGILEKMKSLKFKQYKINLILSGAKTSTIRLFDDKNLEVGDELNIINGETGESAASAVITEIIEKPMGDIKNTDLTGHEKWDSFEEMINTFKTFYGDSEVNEKTVAKIVHFKLQKSE